MEGAPPLPKHPPNVDVVEVYKDKAGEWRWQRFAPNRRIVADSAEGYQNKADAIEGAERQGVEVFVVPDPVEPPPKAA